jgi:hypothetical protein
VVAVNEWNKQADDQEQRERVREDALCEQQKDQQLFQDKPMSDQDMETVHAMRRFGGGFCAALAQAALMADNDNFRRIKEAWPEYWDSYSKVAANEKAAKEMVAFPNGRWTT